ncbi:MAG TPA: hypothetical protein VF008_30110 [Niastella sp.]
MLLIAWYFPGIDDYSSNLVCRMPDLDGDLGNFNYDIKNQMAKQKSCIAMTIDRMRKP